MQEDEQAQTGDRLVIRLNLLDQVVVRVVAVPWVVAYPAGLIPPGLVGEMRTYRLLVSADQYCLAGA